MQLSFDQQSHHQTCINDEIKKKLAVCLRSVVIGVVIISSVSLCPKRGVIKTPNFKKVLWASDFYDLENTHALYRVPGDM